MLPKSFSKCVAPSVSLWLVLAFANWAWSFHHSRESRGMLLMLLGLGAAAGVAAGLSTFVAWRMLRAWLGPRTPEPALFGVTAAVIHPVALRIGLLLGVFPVDRGVVWIIALAGLAGIMTAGLAFSAVACNGLVRAFPPAAARAGRWGNFAAASILYVGAALAAAVFLPLGVFLETHTASSTAGDRSAFRDGSPNIILISLDTVRPDHLSAFGYARETSPHIDAIIRSGSAFTQAIASSSWTVLSHATLFTGASPSRIGPELLEPQDSGRLFLPPEALTMAEVLRAHGYSTAAFIGGATMTSLFGFDQGFDVFDDIHPPSLQMNMDHVFFAPEIRRLLQISRSRFLAPLDPLYIAACNHLYGQGHQPPLENYLSRHRIPKRFGNSASEVNSKVSHYLAAGPPDPENPDRPRFLFVHYFDAHTPYDAPPPFSGEWAQDPEGLGYKVEETLMSDALEKGVGPSPDIIRVLSGKYDEEIAMVDHGVGRLMNMLRAAGLLENAMVVLFSDHGESFGENGNLFHGNSLREELTRIVFAITFPGRVPAGLRIDRQVRAADIMPTLLELAGVEPVPAVAGAEGRSLVSLFSANGTREVDPPAFSELYAGGIDVEEIKGFHKDYLSIREDGWKFVLVSDGTRQLYDLKSDPLESRDLSQADPQRAIRMEAALKSWRSQGFSREDDGDPDPQRIDNLRGLGYISQSR